MSEGITFGGWLRQRRKEQDFTYEELADKIGCSRVALIKIENGERRPSGQVALLLADHLRVPSDEHQAFLAFARTGRQAPGNASLTAPWRGTFVQQTNLPVLLSALIGREDEVETNRNYLLNSKVRLLTLVGPPGIGKTRLGVQVAFDLLASFEDGVYLVDLAPVNDPDMVLLTIAHTLGLKETAAQSAESLLLDFIRQKRMLLVLDNFEQILDASIEVVKLLEASPWLKVLITSREALKVKGERCFYVPTLAVPALDRLPHPGMLMTYASVELFVERAQAVSPHFTLTADNAVDVAALCVGLEGLPLAIELAASRANRLSLSEMRLELASRLKLLRTDSRDFPPRQRTLRGAIRWSYDLLNDEEQRLFRMLGVFVGGFTLEAVQAMRSAFNNLVKHDGDAISTLDLLHLLEERSLLRIDNMAGGIGSYIRFRMWEATREFALESLHEKGERVTAEKLHAHYYARLAHEAAPNLVRAEQKHWLDRLEQEHDNMRVALRWAVETCEKPNNIENLEATELALLMATDLREYWGTRGYYTEGRETLQRLLSLAEGLDCSPVLRLKTLNAAGRMAIFQGDTTAARAYMEQALALGHELGDRQGVSVSLNTLGHVAKILEDYGAATGLFEQSLAISKELDDRRGMAQSLNDLGSVAQVQGDHIATRNFKEQSLAICRELGDRRGMVRALNDLGYSEYRLGNYAVAVTLHEQNLAICRELGDKQAIAFSLNNLGLVAQMQGKLDSARSFHEQSLAIRRELGDKQYIMWSLCNLGVTAFGKGDYARARSVYEEGLAVAREIGSNLGIAQALCSLANVSYMQSDYSTARSRYIEGLDFNRVTGFLLKGIVAWSIGGLGAVAAGIGEAARGTRLLSAASALAGSLNAPPDPEDRIVFERGVASAKAQLSHIDFERAWAEGQAMTLEEAIDHALQDGEVPIPLR